MIKLEMRGRTHDEARVVSAQFTVEADYEALRDSLVAAMEAECAWAEANDVIIGHLKAYIKRGEAAVMLSTTGYGVQVKGEPGTEDGAPLECGIDSITYGASISTAEARLQALAAGLLAGREYETNWDCGDSCTDPSHHHHHHHGHGPIKINVHVKPRALKVKPKLIKPEK